MAITNLDDYSAGLWQEFYVSDVKVCHTNMIPALESFLDFVTFTIKQLGCTHSFQPMQYKHMFRAVRSFESDTVLHVWCEEMLNLDRILALIQDIYLVRAMRLYALEEDLFAKLLFLLRSTEMTIKFTRPFGSTYNPQMFVHEAPKRRRLTVAPSSSRISRHNLRR